MMKQLSVVVAAMTLAWLAPGQVEAQQRCLANVDCGPGWVCAAKQCVQEGSVTVQAGAGAVGAQLSVTDQGAQQLSVTDQAAQLSVTDQGGQQGGGQMISAGIGLLALGWLANFVVTLIGW